MFGLISYIFKIIISLAAGYIIGYSNDSEEKTNFQFFTSLTSFIFASFTGIVYLMDLGLVAIGLLFVSVLYLLSDNLSDNSLLDKYKILFSAVNGVIVGFGFVIYSIIITLLFSYIANNYDIISDLLLSKNKNIDKEKNELDLNEEEM